MRDQSREDLRKLTHLAFSLGAFATPWLGRTGCIALALLGLAHNVLLLPRYPFGRKLLRDGADRGTVGLVTYPLAVALVYLAAPLSIAAAVWVILGFGDALSSIAGRRARARLPWNPSKSWIGSLAFVAAGTLAASAFVSPLVALAGATAGAGIESLVRRGDDNLAIAAAATLVMMLFATIA